MINSYYFYYFCAILMIFLNHADAQHYNLSGLEPVAMKHLSKNITILHIDEHPHPDYLCMEKHGNSVAWSPLTEDSFPDDGCTKDIECMLLYDITSFEMSLEKKPAEGAECAPQIGSNYFGCVGGKCEIFYAIYKVTDAELLSGEKRGEIHHVYRDKNNITKFYDY